MGQVSYSYTVPPVNSGPDQDPAEIGEDADLGDDMDCDDDCDD